MDILCELGTTQECKKQSEALKYFENIRKQILINLSNATSIKDLGIPIDNNCLWNLGAHFRNPLNTRINRELASNKQFKCKACKLIDLLIDVKVKFPIISKHFSLTEKIGISVYFKRTSDFLITDEYTNNILINYYLQYTTRLPIINIFTGFICHNNGYLLSNRLDTLNFDQIPKEYIQGILFQIIKILSVLNDHDFVVGWKVEDLFRISKDYVVYINNLSTCGISVNSLKLRPKKLTKKQLIYKEYNYRILLKERKLYSVDDYEDLLKDQLTDFNYRNSTNLYVILNYLLSFENIRTFVYESNILAKFKQLWLPSEFKKLKFNKNDLLFRLREDAMDIFKLKS